MIDAEEDKGPSECLTSAALLFDFGMVSSLFIWWCLCNFVEAIYLTLRHFAVERGINPWKVTLAHLSKLSDLAAAS